MERAESENPFNAQAWQYSYSGIVYSYSLSLLVAQIRNGDELVDFP